MKRVLVPLADGFEEIEAITTIDILRRAEIEVVIAGLNGDSATGNHGITVGCDTHLDDVSGTFDMLALPGGMPGAKHLRESEAIQQRVKAMHGAEKWVAAICAAPMAIAASGVLDGAKATSYPGFLDEFPNVEHTGALVEKDGAFITARGPGAALDFALELVETLRGKAVRDEVEGRLQRP